MQYLFIFFILFVSPAFAVDEPKKEPQPFGFSLVGACEIALLPTEGAPSSGFVLLSGQPIEGEITLTSEVSLKPGESKALPIVFGAAASRPYILLSLNQVSTLGTTDDVIVGHDYLLTVAMGLDYQTNFPQDPMRFRFSGTSTHSTSFSVYLSGSFGRDYYKYQPGTKDGQTGLFYDFAGDSSFPNVLSYSFLLLHDPRYGASLGGERFIPNLPSRDSYEAVQRVQVTLKLKLEP